MQAVVDYKRGVNTRGWYETRVGRVELGWASPMDSVTVGYVAVRSWFYSEIRVRGCGARLRGEALPWGVRVDRE